MRRSRLWLSIATALALLTAVPAGGALAQDDEEEDAGVGRRGRSDDDDHDRGRRRRRDRDRGDDGGRRSRPRRSGRSYVERPHSGDRPFQLDVHAGFTPYGVGLATGVRFGIPIVPNGFIDSLNNAVYLNFGADFYFMRYRPRPRNCGMPMGGQCNHRYGPGIGFPVTLHWEFYFSERWSAFVEVGGQFFMHPAFMDGDRGFGVYEPGMWFVFAGGASFHINDTFLLTLRLGTPYAAFGLTIQF